jgi:predicted dehydrogenase
MSSGFTLTIPAKLHPEVIVQAVAARDRTRAEEFAKKHGIPEIKDSYQGESWALLYASRS